MQRRQKASSDTPQVCMDFYIPVWLARFLRTLWLDISLTQQITTITTNPFKVVHRLTIPPFSKLLKHWDLSSYPLSPECFSERRQETDLRNVVEIVSLSQILVKSKGFVSTFQKKESNCKITCFVLKVAKPTNSNKTVHFPSPRFRNNTLALSLLSFPFSLFRRLTWAWI